MPNDRDERWQIDDLTIDVGRQAVMRGGEPILLPQLSFRFLLVLVRAAPRLLSIDELMEQVWAGVFVNAETVTQRAKLLRDALGDDPKKPRYFHVRRGAGYQLIPMPELLDGQSEAGGSSGISQAMRLSRRNPLVLGAVVLGLISAVGPSAATVWPDRQAAARMSGLRVAVLPFDNLSSDPGDAYIARGIPEMVLNRLSSVRGLTVISRDSALLGPVSASPVREAGRALDAAYVVKGSVQRAGQILRVTCFVVDTSSGVRLWSERFDWPVGRLYALQDRIADRVASSLESRTSGIGGLIPSPAPTRNVEAYVAFLKGASLLGRFTVADTDAAGAQFERAVALDPDFADAMVALFDAKMQGADLRKDDLAPFRARYQPLLDKALKFNPNSGAALFAKAMWSDEPADRREALFRRAAELDPSNSRGLTAYGQFLDRSSILTGAKAEQAKPSQARALIDKVLAIDPLSPRTRWWAVQRGFNTLPPEQIERGLARELAIDPHNYVVGERYAFRRWMFHGETAEAIEEMERIIATDPQNPSGPHFAVAFYLDANDPAAARAVAATTPASRDASRVLLAQYAGDWRAAAAAAYDRRGYLFNEFQNWNWPAAIRDNALNTRNYKQGEQAIATRYGFDLENPRVLSLAQTTAAPALAHILLASGEKARGNRLLVETVQWIDAHPSFGMGGVKRSRAAAMMLLGNREKALSDLRASIETGHDIRHWWYLIEHDPVWAPARNDPRFKAIAEMCREAARAQRARLDSLRRAVKIPSRPAATRI